MLLRLTAEQLAAQKQSPLWPATYRNRETSREYAPHHDDERAALEADGPRALLVKGGEGGGKSVFGIVKDLERLRRGMSGIMVSPDLPHFKRSLWPEFRRWCPWEQVVERQRYRGAFDWEPHEPFALAFVNGATLYCGGMDEPGAWEGPNVHFAHFDEARRATNANALKVMDGRVRLAGPAGEPPQLYITTTPRKNWLYDYFGPPQPNDVRAAFKAHARVVTLRVRDNAPNLADGYEENRRRSLTEAEARVLLDAEWEDIEEGQRFLPSMALWDACREPLAPPGPRDPMVVALDAATGRTGAPSDCFGVVGVTRHPARGGDVAVRFVQKWQARSGGKIDFEGTPDTPGPFSVLRWLCKTYDVIQCAYDPTELRFAASQITQEGIVWLKEFSQGAQRAEADKQLLDLITQRRIAHDGNADLREHLDNADRKLDAEARRLRIAKREEALKIDLAVCLSMSSFEILRLNL